MTPREFNESSDGALDLLRAKLKGPVTYSVKHQALTGYTVVDVHSFTSTDLPTALTQMAQFISAEDAKTDEVFGMPRWEWHFTHETDVYEGDHTIYLWKMGG